MSFNEYDLIRRKKKTNADFVNIKRKITDDNEKYYQIYSCISLLSHIIHNQPLAYRHSHPKYIGVCACVQIVDIHTCIKRRKLHNNRIMSLREPNTTIRITVYFSYMLKFNN